ncbi:MAG: hypothetical protein WBG71_01115 [Leeuwenhoekiella sp.]
MEDRLIEMAIALLPAVVVGLLAYYFFNSFIKNEDGRRRFLLHKDSQQHTLPTRLQAYERLVLFLERIKPSQLLIRISPSGEHKEDYEQLLISTIEQEFEHNITQQIYISEECWNVVQSAKNTTIQMIRQANRSEESTNAASLRENILKGMMDRAAPSAVAIEYLKNEVSEVLG